MSDHFFFPEEFKCMYCKIDLDPEGMLALPSGESIDLKCPKCNAWWKFWASTQLFHKLLEGGKFNKTKKDLNI